MRTPRILSHGQPIVVTIVDSAGVESAGNIERLVREIEEMIDTGMIAISDVEMIRIEGH